MKSSSPLIDLGTSFVKALVYKVIVDYDRSVEEAIKAGKYDRINYEITSKNFPSNRKGTVETEIILFHPNRYILYKEVICELGKSEFRPAELPELLAFGATYPDVQRKFPVVALGSIWQRPHSCGNVPCLYSHYHSITRTLSLRWFNDGWIPRYRFAAVHK